MKNRLKTAVIGVGNMGINHVRVYSEISNLVAISDINENLGKQIADKYHTNYYKNFQEMLQKEKPDAVSVVIPTINHKAVVIDCLKHKIPVLVEKPLAVNVQEAQGIIKTAKETKTLLTVGHIERFNPAVMKLKEFIKKGIFGQVVSIVIKRVGLYPPQIKDVNVVTDLAVHDLDIVCNLIGEVPKSIFATGGSGLNASRIDYADIFLDFNKISCYIQVNWITPIKIRTLSITGTAGYGELDYITQKFTLYKSSIEASHLSHLREPRSFITKWGQPQKISIPIQVKEPLNLEIVNFLESISKKTNPTVTGEQGMQAVKLAGIIIESITQKKLINLAKN